MEDMLLLLCHCSVLYDAGWATNYSRHINMFISKVQTVQYFQGQDAVSFSRGTMSM